MIHIISEADTSTGAMTWIDMLTRRAELMVPGDQIFIGSVFAVVCLIVVWQARWMREHSKIGRALASRLGATGGLWALRGIFAVLAILGILLATNVLQPLQ